MKLLIGLGNPGEEYQETRHNAGFMLMDYLQAQLAAPEFSFAKKFNAQISQSNQLSLVKPYSFMNLSGMVVRKLVDYYGIKLEDLWVVHDDLDIILGDYKLVQGKGPKIHNGIISIEEQLQTNDFWRVRIGIDNRAQLPEDQRQAIPGRNYVLQRFSEEEKKVLISVFERATQDILTYLKREGQ